MSSLLEGARRLLGRKSDLNDQIGGLEQAIDAATGRLPEPDLDSARAILDRAGARLKLSPEHTVVALAGATGSGKSSTFNALAGVDLSSVGVRRPTTSMTTACVWDGPTGSQELLDWMGIPPRYQTTRSSMLGPGKETKDLKGLILLDLPDHDSTEVAHHLEVDRLIVLADLMIWVLDPQKYADAAVHDRFLKPLAAHRDVMIVALNHIDEVPADRREAMIGDVKRLLDLDGLEGVPVVATSARHGDGIGELRQLVAKRVADKKNARARFRIDIHQAAERLHEVSGDAAPRDLSQATRNELNDAVAESAGVPVVVDAVRRSTRMRSARATGWPPLTWVSKLKPDPLKRLHLDLGARGRELISESRSSVPEPTKVQRARVDTAVRRVVDEVSGGMAAPWVGAIRSASMSRSTDLSDRVDNVVANTPLHADGIPRWCRLVQFLQMLLILAAIAGAVWLGVIAVLAYLQMPELSAPEVGPLALPTVLLLGGVALGLLLALLSRVLVNVGANARARRVDKELRSGITEVCDRLIVTPVEEELDAYRTVREGLDRALR